MLSHLFDLVSREMVYAGERFGPYHDAHQHAAILREEYEEYWEHVKDNTADGVEAAYELVQVAGVALRRILELGIVNDIEAVQEKRHQTHEKGL